MASFRCFEELANGQPVVTENTLTFGPIQFSVSAQWSVVQKTGLQRLFTLAYPRMEHYLGNPNSPGNWQLELKTDNRSAKASCYGRMRRLVLQPNLAPWIIIHELGHVFHGERATHFDFFSEGIAEAVAELVSNDCQLQSPNHPCPYVLGKNTNRAGRTPFHRSHWNRFDFLLAVRTKTAAAAWKECEEKRSGFLRKFHQLWQNTPTVQIGPECVLDFRPSELRKVITQTEAELGMHHLMHHETKYEEDAKQLLPSEMKSRPVVFAYADSNEDKIRVCAAILKPVRIELEGIEEPLNFLAEFLCANVPIRVEVAALSREGSVVKKLTHGFTTPGSGCAALPLSELKERFGKFPAYRIRLDAPQALSEEIVIRL